MNLKYDINIRNHDLNYFLVISFFIFFLLFVLVKGFVKSEEISDITFVVSCVLSLELIFFLITNQKINYKSIKQIDYIVLLTFFLFIFIIWNSETLLSYKQTSIFLILHFILVIFLIFFLKINSVYKNENNSDFITMIIVLSFFFSGLFYQINYSTSDNFILIIALSAALIFNIFILNKLPKWFDFLFSIMIFFILFKVFILSAYKDEFHYSWFLGPINSISDQYKLLENLPSQYGYLNILTISKIGEFINIEKIYIFLIFIFFLFVIFFLIFYFKLINLVKLPITIITLFLCYLIFGNIGYSNLSGSIFIPSSSVFRFLPSLITIIIFSKILEKKFTSNYLNIFFVLLLLISSFWSFESFIFTTFSLGSFLLSKIILYIFYKGDKKKLVFNFRNLFYLLLLITILILFILFLTNKSNFNLFYEHALNSAGSLSKEILNNRVTLVFLYMLMLNYLIVRDTFANKNFFSYNILWFGLFASYSGYFLVRSVDNNFFNILPFILFTTFTMKTNSNNIKNLRTFSLYIIIFFTIVSSTLSSLQSREKFFNRLLLPDYFVLPNFLDKKYLPHKEILIAIDEYPNTPLTLVTGKTIHNKNFYLPNYGYGLPILPLEHFNILKIDIKQNLLDNYFEKNNKHLLLCTFKCEFYSSNNDTNINSKIFVGKNINVKKIKNIDTKDLDERLYVLKKKEN